jgi:hypothetical protein
VARTIVSGKFAATSPCVTLYRSGRWGRLRVDAAGGLPRHKLLLPQHPCLPVIVHKRLDVIHT